MDRFVADKLLYLNDPHLQLGTNDLTTLLLNVTITPDLKYDIIPWYNI